MRDENGYGNEWNTVQYCIIFGVLTYLQISPISQWLASKSFLLTIRVVSKLTNVEVGCNVNSVLSYWYQQLKCSTV